MLPLFPAGILPGGAGGDGYAPSLGVGGGAGILPTGNGGAPASISVTIGAAGVVMPAVEVPAVDPEVARLRLLLNIWQKRAKQAEAALDSVLEPAPKPAPHAPLFAAIQRSTRVSEFREPPGYLIAD